jgi:hypothetical protein
VGRQNGRLSGVAFVDLGRRNGMTSSNNRRI